MIGSRMMPALALCGLALACSKKPDASPDATRAMLDSLKNKYSKADAGPHMAGDPCSLLEVSEVDSAIGPLASAPYDGTYKPDSKAGSCRYDTKDKRRLLLRVDWTDGPTAMKDVHFGRNLTDQAMHGVTKAGKTLLATGDTVAGDWDEVAAFPMHCCILAALRGDQYLEIDWAGTRLTTASAAALLNTAVKRLDHHLAINGNAGAAAGTQRYDTESKDSLIDPCTLVSQKDAEAILGAPLASAPDHGDERTGITKRTCNYRVPFSGGRLQMIYDIEVNEWHDAHATFEEDQWLIHSVGGGPVADSVAKASGPPGPWDEAGDGPSSFEAVKGNLLLRSGTNGDKRKSQALLAKAVAGLGTQAPAP